jgi:hypothetical protein
MHLRRRFQVVYVEMIPTIGYTLDERHETRAEHVDDDSETKVKTREECFLKNCMFVIKCA